MGTSLDGSAWVAALGLTLLWPMAAGAAPADLKAVGPAPGKSCEQLRREGRFSVHFDKVPIEELAQGVADATCKTFILTDQVRGKVSIVGPEGTSARVSADALYAAFLTALDANGFTVQERGSFVRVVEKQRGKQGQAPLALSAEDALPSDDRIVTRVFTLANAELEAVRGVLTPLLTPGGEASAFPPDTLIVSDLGSNLQRLERLLARLDGAGTEELRVFALRHAAASQLGPKVQSALEARRKKPALLLADERTNRLVVVGPVALLERVAALVKELDVPLPGGGQVRVHRLRHVEAKEVGPGLQALTSGAPRAAAAGAAGGGGLFSGEVRVSENEASNSITVVASPGDQRLVAELLAELDRPRRQVFIETAILEVNVDRDRAFGVDWHRLQQVGTDRGSLPVLFGTALSGGGASLSLKSLAAMTGFLAGVQGPSPAGFKERFGFDVPEFGVLLHALQQSSDVNVLSTPHLLTTDNKEAEISVGQKVPFKTSTSQLPASASTAAAQSLLPYLGQNVTRENVELKLQVKPHLGEGGAVRLEITEKTEEIGTVLDKELGPTTSTRGAKTVVEAQDGQTVVLGGLMQDRTIEGTSKVPLLGDLPILGHLFRSTSHRTVKTNLLLILTPHVVDGPGDFRRILERKLKERDRFVAAFYGQLEGLEAEVDLGTKRGPLMAMRRALGQALQRPENGGEGAPDERVIRPSAP